MPGDVLEFVDDPAAFLAVASDHLAADLVLTTVIASVAQRIAAADARGLPRGDNPAGGPSCGTPRARCRRRERRPGGPVTR